MITYPIGTQFIKQRPNNTVVETVVDMLTTTNLAGEVISIRYVAEHEFCGQIIKDRDVNAVTIARGIVK